MKKLAILTIAILALGYSLQAAQPQVFRSIRSAGMGGTAVAVENGIDAMHANPALMSDMGGHLMIVSARVDMDEDYQANLDKMQDFADYIGASHNFTEILTEMVSKTPMSLKGGMSLGLPLTFIAGSPWVLNMISDKWGVGLFNNTRFSVKLVDPTYPTFKVSGQADGAGVLALSKQLRPGLLSTSCNIGVGIKYVGQGQAYNPDDQSDEFKMGPGSFVGGSDDLNVGYKMGTGMGFDLGFLMPMGMLENGKLGVVVKDVFSTQLSGERTVTGDNTEDYSSEIPMSATVGYAGKVSMPGVPVVGGLLTDLTVAADFDLNSETSWFKKMHFGLEKNLIGNILKFRFGNHQGNFTYGLSLDMFACHLSYANFTDELGRKVGINPVTYQMIEAGIYF